jgi:ATP-dependent DNA ligase
VSAPPPLLERIVLPPLALLHVDLMPKWTAPMLAKLSGLLPNDDDRWGFEMKWDGIRGLSFIQGGKLRLMTRNQIEATRRYRSW